MQSNLTGDVLSTGGQTILDSGTDGTNATARLSTITNDGSTTVLNVATGLLTVTVSNIETIQIIYQRVRVIFTLQMQEQMLEYQNERALKNVTTSVFSKGDVLEYNLYL